LLNETTKPLTIEGISINDDIHQSCASLQELRRPSLFRSSGLGDGLALHRAFPFPFPDQGCQGKNDVTHPRTVTTSCLVRMMFAWATRFHGFCSFYILTRFLKKELGKQNEYF